MRRRGPKGRTDLPPPAPGVRGVRPPRDVQAQRVDFVERMYFATGSVTQTARLAQAKHGISRSTTVRVLKGLREKWAREGESEREEVRAELAAGLRLDLAGARARQHYSSVVSIARLLAELSGLLVQREEVTIARSPLDGMSLAELRFVREHGRLPRAGEVVEVEALPALPVPGKTNGTH